MGRQDCRSQHRVRTAFDLGRYLERDQAVARLDSLMRAAGVANLTSVMQLAKCYRGCAWTEVAAGGAATCRRRRRLAEGDLARLLYIDAGLPRPTTQIPIVEGRGRLVRMADMGWEEFMVVSEYDGDQHRTNRWQYTKDIRSLRRARETRLDRRSSNQGRRACRRCRPSQDRIDLAGMATVVARNVLFAAKVREELYKTYRSAEPARRDPSRPLRAAQVAQFVERLRPAHQSVGRVGQLVAVALLRHR